MNKLVAVRYLMKLLNFLLLAFAKAYAQPPKAYFSNDKKKMAVNTSREERWWNLLHYKISIIPDYNKKSIVGTNEVSFIALRPGNRLRIDLQEPMQITKINFHIIT